MMTASVTTISIRRRFLSHGVAWLHGCPESGSGVMGAVLLAIDLLQERGRLGVFLPDPFWSVDFIVHGKIGLGKLGPVFVGIGHGKRPGKRMPGSRPLKDRFP